MPGHTLVVYEPDLERVTDLIAVEDVHAPECSAVASLFECAGPGELWPADRNFCTSSTIPLGWRQAQASFIVREHGATARRLPAVGHGWRVSVSKPGRCVSNEST